MEPSLTELLEDIEDFDVSILTKEERWLLKAKQHISDLLEIREQYGDMVDIVYGKILYHSYHNSVELYKTTLVKQTNIPKFRLKPIIDALHDKGLIYHEVHQPFEWDPSL